MKPSQKYHDLMQQPGFVADSAQQHSVTLLDDLFTRVTAAGARGWWQTLFSRRVNGPPIDGIYLWGGVGRGKTMLMDVFYQSLPDRVTRARTHFHSFMNRIHRALGQHRNTANPLQAVAREIARDTHVLCLDEFVIIDIGDAMIMAGLLEALFREGVVLVTTSNAAPRDLYRDGLQRARFVPAIELIERHCDVVNVGGERDYRLRFLQQTDLYSVPHDAAAEAAIRSYLDQHVVPLQVEQRELVVNGRVLAYRYCAEDTVWFSFAELCESARSQNDYLELARCFNTLILTDIRHMNQSDDDVARRFVLLVDVLYDHHVKLICSAAAAPGELYGGKRLGFEFERTASRLLEMQSSEYLAQGHTLQ
ncbi:MAG: cell division protein ZapE [Gammaproteobacteria bacterium]|nr:cell division protein ZapE [Gammaproteobacteria bacterium]MDH3537787.1 cell division protein ZapE [Gammaproteobacteria bacterium]